MKYLNRIHNITAAISIVAIAIPLLAWGFKPAPSRTVPVAEFKEHFARVGMSETMRSTRFVGIEHNLAVIEVRKMSLINPKKWSAQRIAAKLDDLDPTLRSEVELLAKIPAGTDPSLLTAFWQMKPFAVPEGLARRGEGSEILLWLPPSAKAEIDLSAEKVRLEAFKVDPTSGKLIPQREYLKPGGRNILPVPDEKQGGLYWLRPVNEEIGK